MFERWKNLSTHFRLEIILSDSLAKIIFFQKNLEINTTYIVCLVNSQTNRSLISL